MYAIIDFIRRHIRRHTTTSQSSIERRLRARANSDQPMDEELLTAGYAQLGDIVQGYCDHPPALQNEWFDGDWLHRDCKCGTYLGTVEDQ